MGCHVPARGPRCQHSAVRPAARTTCGRCSGAFALTRGCFRGGGQQRQQQDCRQSLLQHDGIGTHNWSGGRAAVPLPHEGLMWVMRARKNARGKEPGLLLSCSAGKTERRGQEEAAGASHRAWGAAGADSSEGGRQGGRAVTTLPLPVLPPAGQARASQAPQGSKAVASTAYGSGVAPCEGRRTPSQGPRVG